MSEASDKFNALPYDQRLMLGTMLLEAELRLVDQAKRQLVNDHQRAMREHDARAKRIREEIARRTQQPRQSEGDYDHGND